MPLEHSSSPGAFKRNVGTLMHEVGNSPHVQSQKQALAIAYATQRRADGGGVANYDNGGGVDPVDAVISALTAGASNGGSGGIGAPNTAAPSAAPSTTSTSSSPTNVVPQNASAPASTPTLGAGVVPPAPASGSAQAPSGVTSGAAVPTPATPANPASFATPSPAAPVVAPSTSASFAPTTPVVASPSIAPGGAGYQNGIAPPASTTPLNTSASLLKDGGIANRAGGGGFNMSSGPALTAPWTERNEARALHVGPVLSNVPGRTDNHQVKVPAGSYVLPAAHVSSMGEGNTLAGTSIASKMFSGPYGAGAPKIGGHGHMPSPPKIAAGPGIANLSTGGYTYSEGGARGEGHHEPVPVDISGGEFVIHPDEIIRRWGSLKNGHAVLDKFVMNERGKERKTLKALPPPAKE